MKLQDAQALAELYIEKYLSNQACTWEFKFMSTRTRLGCCRFFPFGNRGNIELNEDFVLHSSEEEVLDTILHEIAHAIVGHRAGHNYQWKKVCHQIGCKANRKSRINNKVETVLNQQAKYVAECPTCKTKHYAGRMSNAMKVGRTHCAACVDKNDYFKSRLNWKLQTNYR